MTNKIQVIPAGGLLCTVAVVAYMVVQLNGQATAPTGGRRRRAEARDDRRDA